MFSPKLTAGMIWACDCVTSPWPHSDITRTLLWPRSDPPSDLCMTSEEKIFHPKLLPVRVPLRPLRPAGQSEVGSSPGGRSLRPGHRQRVSSLSLIRAYILPGVSCLVTVPRPVTSTPVSRRPPRPLWSRSDDSWPHPRPRGGNGARAGCCTPTETLLLCVCVVRWIIGSFCDQFGSDRNHGDVATIEVGEKKWPPPFGVSCLFSLSALV